MMTQSFDEMMMQQRVTIPIPPRLQFYASDVNVPPTTNHELFKDAVPRPSYYQHEVRAPFTVGCLYRATDDTTVTTQITQTPSMVDPRIPVRTVIPSTLHAVAHVENKNGLLASKTVTTTAQATMAEGNICYKSVDVNVSKKTSKDWETGVFAGMSRANDENMYRAGVTMSYKQK
jgi:hypothetical protein